MRSTTFATAVLSAFVAVAHGEALPQTSTSAAPAPSSSANVSTSACSPLELVVARGTIEPGPLGIIVGDPLLNATKAVLPGTTGYSVPYPASFATDSVSEGVQDVLAYMDSQPKACPDQKFVMVGYSQGAEVMHEALVKIDTGLYDKMIALVMFGDPGNRGQNSTSSVTGGANLGFPERLANKLKENCEPGDPVCTNTGTDITKHLVYGEPSHGYMNASAAYIKKQVDTNGQAGPEPSPTDVGTGNNTCALASLGVLLGAPGSNSSSSCNSTSSMSAMPSGSSSPSGSGNGSQATSASRTGAASSSSAGGSSQTSPPASSSSSGASHLIPGGIIGLVMALIAA